MGLYADAKDWLSRQLEEGEPETFIEGGPTTDRSRRFQRDRDRRDHLEKFERAYRQGGPVAQLVDTRAYMTFGTGAEFVTDEELTTVINGNQVTPAEWLHDQFASLDNLLVRLGRDNYIYGDAMAETVETRGGGFARVELINPKTLTPEWDEKGRIQRWHQTIQREGMGQDITATFDAEDIAHIALDRIGRNPMGTSLIGRNWDEVKRFAKNQDAIAEALQMHAFVKWQVSVGKEDGPPIDDNEIRRVRQRFNKIRNDDTYITGPDIDIEALDTGGIGEGIGNITENDLTHLAAGFGVPEEMAGLGRGSTEATAKVRLQAFERSARAEQRAMADQFIDAIVRPVLDRYSPWDGDIDIQLSFDDVVSDQAAVAEWLRDFKGIYTPDEMRDKLGDGPVPEDVDEDDLGVPGDEGEQSGGLFDTTLGGPGTGNRSLADGGNRLTEAGHEAWEAAWHDAIEGVLWSDATDRQLFEFNPSDVPEFVTENLRNAILSDAFFSDFDSVDGGARVDIQTALVDSLESQHGWSIDSITENLQSAAPELDDHEAERIARSETQAAVARAREAGYRERLDMDEARFDWVGPSDHRTTEACSWIKDQIPEEGVTLERLKDLIQEANDRFVDHEAREYTPHIQCRHTYTRQV